MSDSKISALSAASALGGTELFPIDQSATTLAATAAQIKTFCSASPNLVTPALGAPASGNLANTTGFPAANLGGLGAGASTLLAGTASGTGGLAGTASPTFTGTVTEPLQILGGNGAASVAAMISVGTQFTGGSGTTTFPFWFIQPTGTSAQTNWNTNGTMIGINAPAAWTGDFLNFKIGGVSTSRLVINVSGNITTPDFTTVGGTLNLTNGSNIVGLGGGYFMRNNATGITSPAAAQLQFGNGDAAAPTAQTMGPQNVVGGTSNVAGQNWTINGSRGTGTGIGGSIIFQTAKASTTGSTQNALAAVLTLDQNGLLIAGASFTVAGLPAAAAGNKGARTFITDGAAVPVFGAIVSGAGSLFLPVFSDGTNWRNG